MFVVKRDGSLERVIFDKITERVQHLTQGLDPMVDPLLVAQRTIAGVHNKIKTTELDTLAAEVAASMATVCPDYDRLAGRIVVSNIRKMLPATFSGVVLRLKDEGACIGPDVVDAVLREGPLLDKVVADADVASWMGYFGIRTLLQSVLLKRPGVPGEVGESIEHMLMRVALGIHQGNVVLAVETFELMAAGLATHASPTLFNAGTTNPQMASCYLTTIADDSITGIYRTVSDCAAISRLAGGLGVSVHDVRAAGAVIKTSQGRAGGLVPMLRVFSATARYVSQSSRRKGAIAIYLEPWHADIKEFLDLKLNHGKDELRARDLFYGLWVSDLFMRRVKAGGPWSLFCPSEAPGLADVHGAAFEELYTRYESTPGLAREVLPAQKLWRAVLETLVETGGPYIMNKDACNAKSNQQHLGTIRGSNLCTEIVQFTSRDEIAVCNLASVSLAKIHAPHLPGGVDYESLARTVRLLTRNLNAVIDGNLYPLPEAKTSNDRHRPIGLGVQGLADLFLLLDLPFDSREARRINVEVFETIYYAALDESCRLAEEAGAPYDSYPGSPASHGILQMDMWGVRVTDARHDWSGLRERIARHGLANSLLVAPMPTASTSQMLGNNECFEPYTSNIYKRGVLGGEYNVINRHLVRKLQDLGLWSVAIKDSIVAAQGSVQGIASIPDEIKTVFRTVWEIPQRSLIDMAADRAPFIDQSQSLNLYMQNPTDAKLSGMLFHAWERGLKTIVYYFHTRAAASATQVTIEVGATKRGGISCDSCSG